MSEPFAEMLKVGGKSNSLGKADEVIRLVFSNKSRLEELYNCLFDEDAWVRMRASDSLEKICRVHPDWLDPYIDKFLNEFSSSTQPSIQWHLAQMYAEVSLSDIQKPRVISWLKETLSSDQIDWIVAANAMATLTKFTKDGLVPKSETVPLLRIQRRHKSKAVVKRADRLIDELAAFP